MKIINNFLNTLLLKTGSLFTTALLPLFLVSINNAHALPNPLQEGNCNFQKLGPSQQTIDNKTYPSWAYIPNVYKDSWAVPVDLPVVLIMHGVGFNSQNNQSKYHQLAELLASHCLAVFTPDWPAVDKSLGQESMFTTISNAYLTGYSWRLGRNVALIGHSAGGDIVMRHADEINGLWKNGGFLQTQSIITMAASISDNHPAQTLRDVSPSLMVMQASHDTDATCTSASCSFRLYDKAGAVFNSSNSSEARYPNKTLWFLKFPNGNNFNSGHRIFTGGNQIPKAYVSAYLQWHVLNKGAYRSYFSEQKIPDSVEDLLDGKEILVSYSDNHKHIVANFENNNTNSRFYDGSNSKAGTIGRTSNVSTRKVRNAYGDKDKFSSHQTRLLDVRWDETTGSSYVRFRYYSARRLDIRNYETLTFRAGQRQQNGRVEEDEPAKIRVRLRSRDNNGDYAYTDKITRYVHWPVSKPDAVDEHSGPAEDLDLRINTVSSITIPLDEFDYDRDFNKAKLEEIRIYLDGEGAITIDDIEFTDKYDPPT